MRRFVSPQRVVAGTVRRMDMWSEAFDAVTAVDGDSTLSTDQRLKVAEIKALLSISQELSRIHHEGINPDYDRGTGSGGTHSA